MNARFSGADLEASDDDDEPLTKADLKKWGRQFENEFMAKTARRVLLALGTVVLLLLSAAWYTSAWRVQVENRVDIVEIQSRMIPVNTAGIQNISHQIDSLRMEMRYMPYTIVQELGRSGWHPRP